jgi:hypothetical protein
MNIKPTWEPESHKTKYISKKKTKKMKYKNLKMTHRNRTTDKASGHLQIQPQRNELKILQKKKKKTEQKINGNPQRQRKERGE